MPIAYDSSAIGDTSSGTSKTFPHTCTGSNLWLGVGDTNYANTNDTLMGMTYAGVSMPSMQNVASSSTRMWYNGLAGPATGANNVVISFSSSTDSQASSHSYTGCAQSGQPDNSGSAFTNGATTLSKSLVSVADNCWLVGTAQNTVDGSISPSSGTTMRTQSDKGFGSFDKNAATTPAGSVSIGVDINSSGTITLCVATIAPFIASAVVDTPFQQQVILT